MKDHLIRRYIIFLCGLMVISFGISIITKASLGTSPITSIPYSLSLIFTDLTLGNWTILFSILLVALQLVMLGKDADRINILLQIVVSFVFGYFIDFAMMCMQWFEPEMYVLKVVSVVLGCFILAIGVYLQLVANVVMVPGDGFVYALTMKLRKDYGKVRITSDMTMVIIAAVIGLIGLGTLGGVREGTIISALLVGFIARQYMKRFTRLTELLIPGGNVKKLTVDNHEERSDDNRE